MALLHKFQHGTNNHLSKGHGDGGQSELILFFLSILNGERDETNKSNSVQQSLST